MGNYSAHCFSVDLALRVGLNEAIILQHFHYWHTLNESNDTMQSDGKTWFFLSNARIRQVFPYLSERKIRTAIEHLVVGGYIVKDEGRGYNRSTWYALTKSALMLFSPSDETSNAFVKTSNAFSGNVESIDSNIDNNIDNNIISEGKEIYKEKKKFDFRTALIEAGVTEEVADAWLQVRKTKHATNTKLAFDETMHQIEISGYPADDCIRMAAIKSWRGFSAAWMLNAIESENVKSKETSFTRNLRTMKQMFGNDYGK